MQQSKKLLHYIGAKIHQGQTILGVDKAPQAIRDANLFKSLENKGYQIKDWGDICHTKLPSEAVSLQSTAPQVNNMEYLDPLLKKLHDKTFEAANRKDGFVLNIGGDHSIATGTISALKRVHPRLKVIWVDAHADIGLPQMTDSTTYHGKPVSHLMGLINQKDLPGFEWLEKSLESTDIAYIGIRDLDVDEKQTLVNHNIKCYTLDHILKFGGIGRVMEDALLHLDPRKENLPLHVSFDIDGVDPIYAPGTGTRARGGLDYRESHYIMRRLQSENFISMDMVEINPDLDNLQQEKMFGDDPYIEGTQTVALGCDLILSALGRNDLFFLNKNI